MKYENFSAASDLCIKINKKQSELDELNHNEICVRVAKAQEKTLYTIGADPQYEHEYTNLAIEFVQKIKDSIELEITNLKRELADL